MKINKCIIPAAGLGSRMLPLTNLMPKELLPIYNRCALEIIFEEIFQSDINEVILIWHPSKVLIKKYSKAFWKQYAKSGKVLRFVPQPTPMGLGHAVLQAKHLIEPNEYFLVLLPDNLIKLQYRLIEKIINIAKQEKNIVLGIEKISKDEAHLRGLVQLKKSSSTKVCQITNIIEKPSSLASINNYGLSGRFVLNSKIFEYLADTEPDAHGEIQLTHALQKYLFNHEVLGYKYGGTKFDIGNFDGYYKAFMYFGMQLTNNPSELKQWVSKSIY